MGDSACYGMQGSSLLGLCKTYYGMFRGATEGVGLGALGRNKCAEVER